MKLMSCILPALCACGLISAGEQRIVVLLREPLREENVRLRLPEVRNEKGEVRDFEKTLWLAAPVREKRESRGETVSRLDLKIKSVSRQGAQVVLVLPEPGYVELSLRDFYGKNLESVTEGQYPAGKFSFPLQSLVDEENQGIKFLTLKLDGKVVLKRVLTRIQ